MDSRSFFRKNLSELLEHYEISAAQLSHKISVPEEKILSWLGGIAAPTYSQLVKLADCLRRPIIYFFLENPVIQSFEIDFRKTNDFSLVSDKKRLSELIDSLMIYKASMEDLFSNGGVQCCLHEWIKHKHENSFKSYLRNELNFSISTQCQFKKVTDVIEYLREQFYRCGIYIFKDSFRLENVSGICAYDDNFPIILLNNKMSFTRQLFTIFHELYHLLSRASHIDLVMVDERECDKFAGEFLIPEENLLHDIKRYQLSNNTRLCEDTTFIQERAENYHVSREAYLYQLLVHRVVSQDFYSDFRRNNEPKIIRSRQDDIAGGNYYYTKMNYLGKSYLGDIVSGYFAGKLSIYYVAQYTQMKAPSAKKMLTMMSGGRY